MKTPKYFSLMEQLKKDIMEGRIKPGDKLPSENEMADKYDISRHTVRKALSILSNEGFIVAEHGKGTFCSGERIGRSRVGKSHNIAVVTTYISDYIFPRLIQGIDRVLTEEGYSIFLKNTGNSRKNEERCLADILRKDIDGLIIEPSKSEIYCRNLAQYEMLDQMGVPYVFIQGTYMQLKDKPNIVMDDAKGGYMVTDYLISLGHKNIAGIFKNDDTQGKMRHKGYVKALQDAGLDYNPDLVTWFHTEDRDVKPAEAVKQMIADGMQFDAIVCYNDQIAMEVIDVLLRHGIRVPDDVSVTGYDNSFMALTSPVRLTTIAHPQDKLGEMAAELLLEKIRKVPDSESRVKRVIEPELIVGDSCKRRA
ncbi:MAG: GntR family transcriptional regulator [Lachnospiraceae bacterium]|nr:GntR family transcriptional regulator [Lachnospiraceae bacterium]